MPNLICPHCHTEVPFGASVCTGCQAEVHYGNKFGLWHYVGLFFLALFVSGLAGSDSTIRTRLFLLVLVGGGYFLWKNNEPKNTFKRQYKTR